MDGSNADETADMQWKLAVQFEEGWPENTAEGCVQASQVQLLLLHARDSSDRC